MAHFLFVDGSGRDPGASPYEVLVGVAIEDRDVWSFVQAIADAQFRHFGRSLAEPGRLRARALLKRKTFRLAAQLPSIPVEARRTLARACLDAGAGAGRRQMAALAQAKLAFTSEVLELCARYRCRFVASIVTKHGPRPAADHIRKDFAFLFERFFYLLDDLKPAPIGVVVCDGSGSPTARMLVAQMTRYFRGTLKGRQRASLIVPEPVRVHGVLETGLDIAGLVAYVTSWAFRTKELKEPARRELESFREQVRALRYRAIREIGDNPNFVIWGFSVITDLRTREEREGYDG